MRVEGSMASGIYPGPCPPLSALRLLLTTPGSEAADTVYPLTPTTRHHGWPSVALSWRGQEVLRVCFVPRGSSVRDARAQTHTGGLLLRRGGLVERANGKAVKGRGVQGP